MPGWGRTPQCVTRGYHTAFPIQPQHPVYITSNYIPMLPAGYLQYTAIHTKLCRSALLGKGALLFYSLITFLKNLFGNSVPRPLALLKANINYKFCLEAMKGEQLENIVCCSS